MSLDFLTDWQYLSLIIVVGWALFIIAIERLNPYDPGEKFFRRGFWVDFVGYALIQSYLLSLVINHGLIWLDSATGYAAHGVLSSWPIWLQLGFFVVFHDFYIYWFHRFQHGNKYLWRIHEAHHSAKHIDWVAGSRSHSVEILINQSVEVGAMVLLGIHPDVVLIKMMLSVCWSIWIHCNIDVHTGWLQKVINGPEMHRWHHSLNYPETKQGGVNFATKFAFWDWIWGTAYFPKEKPGVYGISNAYPQDDPSLPVGAKILDTAKVYLAQHAAMFRRFNADEDDPEQAALLRPCPPWPGRDDELPPRHDAGERPTAA